jgi:hypothetical protein
MDDGERVESSSRALHVLEATIRCAKGRPGQTYARVFLRQGSPTSTRHPARLGAYYFRSPIFIIRCDAPLGVMSNFLENRLAVALRPRCWRAGCRVNSLLCVWESQMWEGKMATGFTFQHAEKPPKGGGAVRSASHLRTGTLQRTRRTAPSPCALRSEIRLALYRNAGSSLVELPRSASLGIPGR